MDPILHSDSPRSVDRGLLSRIVKPIKSRPLAPSSPQLPCPSPTPPQQWAVSVLPSGVACECTARAITELSAQAKFDKRRSEFAQGRACLHGLLEEMGETQKVGTAEDRSPIWPAGFVGSLSHSDAWIWGCVARQSDLVSIGIDTELIASTELRQDVQDTIATDAEWNLVGRFSLTPDEAFTLVFSAKEAFYKCWYPLVETYFDFFDVEVVGLTPSTLSLKTLPTHPGYRTGPGALNVHYSICNSSVFTATWMKTGDE